MSIQKILCILSNESKFMPYVQFRGISKLERRRNSNLEKLLHMNITDKKEFNFRKPMDSEHPHLYGLLKIHKSIIHLRPILSMCRSPIYNLAKWLTKLQDPIRRCLCKYYVKDYSVLVNHLGDNNIKGKAMCSFDMNSLFTNVLLKMTIVIL